MPDDITENEALYSPYLAAIEGRDDDAQFIFFERFAQQSPEIRQFIASPDTASAIKELVNSGTVPGQYAVAIAKIVALVAVDDIQIGQINNLLEKLGLTQEQAKPIEQALLGILGPVLESRAREALPEQLPEIPPLTTKLSPIENETDSSKAPDRNIIDLRNKPLT